MKDNKVNEHFANILVENCKKIVEQGNKKIAEMAKVMYGVEAFDLEVLAEALYNAGYKKESETAENIFIQAIEKVKERFTQTKGYTTCYDVVFVLENLAKEFGVELKETEKCQD